MMDKERAVQIVKEAAVSAGSVIRERGPVIAQKTLKAGQKMAGTKTGNRVITGVGAGAALGLVLPVVTVKGAAIVCAAGLVLWKALTDKDGA